MGKMMTLVAALAAACAAPSRGAVSAALASGPDAGVDAPIDAPADTPADSPIGAAPDAAPDAAPIDCKALCLAGDREERTLVDPSGTPSTFRQDSVSQPLSVDSAGGTVEVVLELVGNFGCAENCGSDPRAKEGVTVTVGSAPPCESGPRTPGEPGTNTCHVTLTVAPGHVDVPVTLYQWNGGSGWTVTGEYVALVLH